TPRAQATQQGIHRPFTVNELNRDTQPLNHLSVIARQLLKHRQHAVLDDSFAKLCGKAIDRHRRYCSARILALQGTSRTSDASPTMHTSCGTEKQVRNTASPRLPR